MSDLLFDIDPEKPQDVKVAAARKALVKRVAKAPKKLQRGCEFCPQNNVQGIKKVKGFEEVKGRRIMLWAQNPGKDENVQGKALIGRAGQLLWKDAALVGLTREMCDVQNVVRCRTPKEELVQNDYGDKELRIIDGEPSKEIAHCCSVYTEQAIQMNGGKALVHLVLGTYAAKTLLGREYRKDKKVFWSKRLKAHVICTYHPSYFNRGGSASRREQFRAALRAAKELAEGKSSRFAFLESQDYKEQPPTRLGELKSELIRAAKAGIRIVLDIEDGKNSKGQNVLVMVGFCYKPGKVRCVFYDHPEADPKYKPLVAPFLKEIFENPLIRKSLHHGSYDGTKVWKLLKTKIKGYDFDTNYSEYMAYSDRKAYGLAAIAEARFPKFAGYKDILEPYQEGDGVRKNINFYKVPKRVLILYNSGDCDLSKRTELTTKKKVDPSLMKVFILAGYAMDEMQERGPLFDYKYYPQLEDWIPQRLSILNGKLKRLTKNPTFNVNAPGQVYDFVFEKLHLEKNLPDDWIERNGLNTQKETMELLAPFHPAPRLIIDARRFGKIKSTYMTGFKRSADMHKGRVKTNWWLTGTATGRLRSGGGKKAEQAETGLVNMQNIDGAPEVESMLISDTAWWNIYKEWLEGSTPENLAAKYADTDVFLGFDQSQLEMRILAQMSGDPLLIKATLTKYDIHSSVGFMLTKIPMERIKKDRKVRTLIKGLHFGIVYGLQKEQLYAYIVAMAKDAGMKPEEVPSKKEVFDAYDRYFAMFKRVKPFMESQIAHAEEHGYVQTMFGFRREIFQSSERQSFWKNQAMNTPIQGSAHQLMLIALAVMRLYPKMYRYIWRLCMEIHDATYSFVKLKHLPEARKQGLHLLTKGAMHGVKKWWPKIDWKIGLQVEAKAGYRLGVLAEYEGETPAEFIQKWCEKNQKFNKELKEKVKKDLQEVA